MNQRPLADAFFEARDLGPQPLANLGGLLRAEPRDLRKPAGAAPIDQRGQIGEGGHTGRSQVVCDVGRQPGGDRIGRLRGQGAQHPVEGVQGGAQRRHRARAAPCGPARGLAVFGGRGVQFIQQGLQLALREVGIALFEFGQGRAGTGRRRGQGRRRRQRPLEDAGEAGALLGVVVALARPAPVPGGSTATRRRPGAESVASAGSAWPYRRPPGRRRSRRGRRRGDAGPVERGAVPTTVSAGGVSRLTQKWARA